MGNFLKIGKWWREANKKNEEFFETFSDFKYKAEAFILSHVALSEGTDIGSLIQLSGSRGHNKGLEEEQ